MAEGAEDDFDNFMERVTEVESLVKMLRCSDPRRRAGILMQDEQVPEKQVDDLLGEGEGGNKLPLPRVSCIADRTVINHKAFEQMGRTNNPAEMSKELFMVQVEKDAQRRAKDCEEKKQCSDQLKTKANEAFREKKIEKAFDLYSKAIDETRDSALLYENRALTSLHLELFQRVVDDCERALRLNENSLKALLYKAKALYFLKEGSKSEKCISEAFKKHPQHHKLIQDYKEMWMNAKKC